MYLFFIVKRYGSPKTVIRWFLRAKSTVLYLLYIRLFSVCSRRILFSPVGSVLAGTCAMWPESGRSRKAVPDTCAYCLRNRRRPR